MELSKLELSEDRMTKLKEAVDKRFGTGYFGLNAGIDVEIVKGDRYDFRLMFCNFNSVSGWATVGGCRWDEKKQRYIINFRGNGLGRTGKYN